MFIGGRISPNIAHNTRVRLGPHRTQIANVFLGPRLASCSIGGPRALGDLFWMFAEGLCGGRIGGNPPPSRYKFDTPIGPSIRAPARLGCWTSNSGTHAVLRAPDPLLWAPKPYLGHPRGNTTTMGYGATKTPSVFINAHTSVARRCRERHGQQLDMHHLRFIWPICNALYTRIASVL